MKNRLRSLLFASLAGVLSCSVSTGPGSSRLSLSADRGSYASGAEIVAQLENDGSGAIRFSWCDLTVERQDPAGWTALPPAPRACALMLYILRAGERDEESLFVDSPLPPANYRLLLSVRSEESSEVEVIHSAPFTVTAE